MTQRKIYTLAEDGKPYFFPLMPWGSQQPLPNLIEITDPLEALRKINWAKANIDYHNIAAKVPNKAGIFKPFPTYVKLFLNSTPMGGDWDGSGILLTGDWSQPRVFCFALCLHEKTEEGHSPNHSRGWHPGHCKHCNMDMSVDSGD